MSVKDYKCPLCGQYMDFIVVSHKNKPFIDGKLYPKMCFGCFHVPQDYLTTYSPDGTIESFEGPFYSHRKLQTPEELLESGSVDDIRQAKKCVEAVKRSIRNVGVKQLDKLKIKKPEPDYDFNSEYEEQQLKNYLKKKKR